MHFGRDSSPIQVWLDHGLFFGKLVGSDLIRDSGCYLGLPSAQATSRAQPSSGDGPIDLLFQRSQRKTHFGVCLFLLHCKFHF